MKKIIERLSVAFIVSSALFVGNPQFQGTELRAFALDLNSCSSSNRVRC